ncbi:glycyl-tRNA synthetase beta chain [secondary endosymbiont of Heteropsylla cubana]|uniref:Glycine--tRNA ligase beta subunit n=1 Tax=secondary endosymbiont of Heteropsylla cubana TaxID=134287 RepID=J3TYK5_9ENTR|nr:glycine--tRNA ligase subunit beta [secondary endosymbiont of Heteropsylla cubana]AFP85470.1 glycyl-tRNA synthetase beta chain [secondary endosymbiont of Heteropsylla cubana]
MKTHTFLVEIGTEELPPKELHVLAKTFSHNITNEFEAAKVQYGKVRWFATPRRLAVKITSVGMRQVDDNIEQRGPRIEQAFDITGQPTKLAEAWAYRMGITVAQAERLVTDKGKWLIYRSHVKGKKTQELLCGMVNRALKKLPTEKMMRWGNNPIHFIRPVHTVVLLLDKNIISGNVLGVPTHRIVFGHRFMGEQHIILEHANEYPQIILEKGFIIADYLQRKEKIRKDVIDAAKELGGIPDLNDNLLEEVTSLVEWPVTLSGCFDKKFLSMPPEVLTYIMKRDQKYFPLYDAHGNLLPNFIFIANINSEDPQQLINGNEKVIHPRLSDAEFFFKTDRNKRLEEFLPDLKKVIFQKELGSLFHKSKRIETLSAWIAERIKGDIINSARAGLLSKCDLITNMVCEFNDIQGIIGMHYARFDEEQEVIAIAQKEQYQPRFPNDSLPTTLVSCAVAIADKIDTLTGMFGIGKHPTGDKDPFALRRLSLGILRIIIEKELSLDLQSLTEEAIRLYDTRLTNNRVTNDTIDFIFSRLRNWYQEKGYNICIIKSVLACRPTNPLDFDKRIRAVTSFYMRKEASILTTVNKRISNILAKSNDITYEHVNSLLLKEPAEIFLGKHLLILQKKLNPLFAAGYYEDALLNLSTLGEPLNDFFKKVMVMVDEPNLRINRLTLLRDLRHLFLRIADLSMLEVI